MANDHHPLDLISFATALKSRPDIAGMIFDLRDVQSARTDLAIAFEMACTLMSHLDQMIAAPSGSEPDTIALALVQSAIILYSRATATKSDHRKTFDIRSKLTPDELRVHKMLIGLRNDAIAHFGPGDPYDGPQWQRDALFVMPTDDDGAQLMSASHRLTVSKEICRQLHAQTHRALLLTERMHHERELGLLPTLIRAMGADPAIQTTLLEHKADLLKFFVTQAAVDEALAGVRSGLKVGTARF